MLNSRIFKTLISCVLVLSLALSVMVPAFAAPADTVSVKDAAANEMLEDWIDTYVYYINRVEGIPESPQDPLNLTEGGPTNGPIYFEGVIEEDDIPAMGKPCGATTYRWSDKYQERQTWEKDRNLARETDYWISAIQFEGILDVYEFMEDDNPKKEEIRQLIDDLYMGYWFSGNHPTWDVNFPDQNYYNDDQAWWGMALSRAFRLTGDMKYLKSSDYLVNKVFMEWDDTDYAAQGMPNAWGGWPWGGIPWRRVGNDAAKAIALNSVDKNFCTEGNSCYAALTLARTYRELEDETEDPELKAQYHEDYLRNYALGEKSYYWNKFHYVNTVTGQVTNGSYRLNGTVNHLNNGGPNVGVSFPTRADGYNHGTAIGSSYEMYRLSKYRKIDGDYDDEGYYYTYTDGRQFLEKLSTEEFLAETKVLLDYALDQWTMSDGLTMDNQGTGDDAAWKNILWYIAADIILNGDEPEFDGYEKYFEANAIQAWNHRNDLGIANNVIYQTNNGRIPSICSLLGVDMLYWADFDPDKEYDYDLIGVYKRVPGRYEAEEAESSDLMFQSDATASMGQTVQYWDADNAHVASGYVKFKVNAEVAGDYNVNLVYMSRNQNGTRHIQINDGPDEMFSFPAGNNNTYQTVTVPATLKKGENTIKISYWNNDLHAGQKDTQSWWYLDYLTIDLVDADEDAAEEMMDAWLDTFLAERTTKDGDVVGLTSWRWSDKWQERDMDVASGEPRETDFWLSAIVFESFNDVLEYGHDEAYKEKIKEVMYGLYEGFAKSGNHPNWDVDVWTDNTYNDDLCWWTMALLRAYQLTGEQEYFDLSKQMLDKLLTDYDTTPGFGGEPYGGILWRRSEVTPATSGSKNACSNGNGCLISYRFAQQYAAFAAAETDPAKKAEYEALEAKYAEFGDNIYTWAMAHLYKGDGYVIDNVRYNGGESTAQFTYNYGVMAGAAYERYNYYGNDEDLDRATEIMDSAFERFTQDDGYTITGSEGTGDSAGFKTIMLRVAADMYNDGNAPQYKDFLEVNAVRAYRNRRDSDGLVGANIRTTPGTERLCSPCAILGPSLLYWAGFSESESADSWAWSGSEEPNKYEAEWARLYHMALAENQYNGNSGYDDITYWDNGGKDGFVEFLVEAPEAGGYMLDFHYIKHNFACDRLLTVNGAQIGNIHFDNGASSGTEAGESKIVVSLKEGKNTVRLSYVSGDTWAFPDYLTVASAKATIEEDTVKVNGDIVISVITEGTVTRVGLVDENGKYLGKKDIEATQNDDGTITWTVTTSLATKGDRTIGVVIDDGSGVLTNTPIATVNVTVADAVADGTAAATISEVKIPETAAKNEVFTVEVTTSTGVSKIGIFTETGSALGKISQNYEDKDGERTWTITTKLGSRGTRELTVKVADATGNWVDGQTATSTIVVK